MVSPSQDLIDQLNDAMDDPVFENVLTPLMKNTTKNMSFFHLNISSLCFHIEELTTLISEHDLAFNIIGISDCWLKLNKAPLNSVQISGCNFEFTLSE